MLTNMKMLMVPAMLTALPWALFPSVAPAQDDFLDPDFDAGLYRQVEHVTPVLLGEPYGDVRSQDMDEGPAPPPILLASDFETPVYDPVVDSPSKSLTKSFPYRRYNEVRQKSSHNSFQRQEALIDQLVYHRVRSLELDLHVGKGWSWPKTSQNWYVYHHMADTGTTCHRLSDCLDELRSFHDANPNHEVVTVFLDMKDDWQSSVMPADLDTRIHAHLPSSMVFRPADLVASCSGSTTLQGAASTCGWPYLRDMRGKFIFALTGSADYLNTYVSNGAADLTRSAFVAHKVDSTADLDDYDYGVFFNMTTSSQWLGTTIQSQGFIGRSYYVNDSSTWSQAESYRIHHLATDKINYHQDSWAKTHSANGWPFECFSPCSTSVDEPHQTIGVEVSSEDIWGSNDHFRFQYEYNTDTNFWTAAIDTRNSHTEDWAKACLMARYSTSSNSMYFAVCRPNDAHRLRIQWRTSNGGGSDRTDGDIVPSDTVDEESVTRVGLYVYSSGKCAAGYGSLKGDVWKLIGYKCYGSPLYRQGLASSSHGGGKIKFLYSQVKKNGVTYSKSTFPYYANIGSVYSASVFDGIMP